MVARPRAITVERGSRGFGLSLIYRGLDKYEEKDTGIFVARVVPGGQAARYGVRENDKILTINAKTPRNVDDAVGVIKQAGAQIKLVVLREEDGAPDITIDEAGSVASGQMGDSSWGGQQPLQPISRSGSARSFNTSFGRAPASPSPRPPRANQFGQPGQSGSLPGHPQGGHNQSFQQQQQQAQQQEFLRQQQEYKLLQERQQRQKELEQQQQQQQHQQQQLLAQQAAIEAQQVNE